MTDIAAIISAVASLFGAIAWPAALFGSLLLFRKQLRSALDKIPHTIDRLRALKIGAVETQLDQFTSASSGKTAKDGSVSLAETEAAAKIEVASDAIGTGILASKLDELCLQYDLVRRTMPPGEQRTQAMTQIVAQMRTLGLAVIGRINAYKTSGSPGSRLAAVAMMQMDPQKADVPWLVRRFQEDQPFVFYHAALALQNVANVDPDGLRRAREAAQEAIVTLQRFDGTADQGSLKVLHAILASSP